MNDKKEDKLGGKDGGNYSATGSSSHYKNDLIEFIDNIERMFGSVTAYLTCESNVIKYRGRAGKKEGVPADKDLVKANWYEACGQYLREKIDLFNRLGDNYLENDWITFLQKYGDGRVFIDTPFQIRSLFSKEFRFKVDTKSLGTIVDEKLKK